MAYMQWTEDLDSGISVIDEQHKRIVFYINELERVSQAGNQADIRHVLEGLIDYTITHFQFEEELQEKANYPFVKAHRRVHDIFKRRIAGFVERANRGEDILPELLPMLRVWLSTHIKGDDRDYVATVKAALSPVDPEHAGWLASTLKRLFGAEAPLSAR